MNKRGLKMPFTQNGMRLVLKKKTIEAANIIAIIIAIVSMIATIACALTIPTSINKEQYQELIETIKIYNNE